MAAATDLVGVIESAYRLDLGEDEWLRGLVRGAGSHLDRGMGVYGFRFDASRQGRFRIWGTVVGEGAVIRP